ncbi:MAG TPA: protoporphyrinogen oxidase, partial [Prolixibacteraceae bacterium]|nr:protoporphyrinogen oxidase [Prolixibacteraceae bacterium]
MYIKPNIAVIGAGLTGLTAAYYLKKQGHSVTIFEKGTKPGGVIQTHNENGFIYESGPNTGVLGNPEAVELLEALYPLCELEVADQAAKTRWIWKGN